MKRTSLISIIVLFFVLSCQAQCSTQQKDNNSIVKSHYDSWSEKEIQFFNSLPKGKKNLAGWGVLFLGKPYVAATLEEGDDTTALINLTAFDCTTFVETALALQLCNARSKEDYASNLEKVRYRAAKSQGYSSRLHYLSEWIIDNQEKGLVEDITAALGGVPIQKEINFMSKHRKLYVALEDATSFENIKKVELDLSKKQRYVILKERVSESLERIQEGDIIGLATAIDGLDFVHVGIAIWDNKKENLHLLHASSVGKKVEISEKPLVEHLKGLPKVEGIVVVRVK